MPVFNYRRNSPLFAVWDVIVRPAVRHSHPLQWLHHQHNHQYIVNVRLVPMMYGIDPPKDLRVGHALHGSKVFWGKVKGMLASTYRRNSLQFAVRDVIVPPVVNHNHLLWLHLLWLHPSPSFRLWLHPSQSFRLLQLDRLLRNVEEL